MTLITWIAAGVFIVYAINAAIKCFERSLLAAHREAGKRKFLEHRSYRIIERAKEQERNRNK